MKTQAKANRNVALVSTKLVIAIFILDVAIFAQVVHAVSTF